MSGPLLYNPTRASFDELDATLIARRELIDKLTADLIADSHKKTRRHWLLIGPRGSGKSHLTEHLAKRLRRDHGWAVARLSEEQYQVNTVGDLLEQILLRLEEVDDSPLADVSAADLEDRAIDRIHAWKKQHGQPILVVVENLGHLFERKLRGKRDQSRLRELLGRDAPFVLVATATSHVDATTSHGAPFYDFFQTLTLDELTRDEVTALIEARARWDDEKILLDQIDRARGRIHAMFHFSGGYPRLALALYEILRHGVTDDLFKELMELLDQITPYYQARLNDIAPQAARILTEIALAGTRLSPSAIAKRCRLPTNQVTAHIAKLEAERFIKPGHRPDGRRRYYDLTDRLFRIWMQMREDRSARQRLRFLSQFYQHWYAGQEDDLDEVVKRTAGSLVPALMEGSLRRCHEHLRTLGYLSDALPGRGIAMALRRLDLERFAVTEQDATALLAGLPPLLADPDPFVRGVGRFLSAQALVRLGRVDEALNNLAEIDQAAAPEFAAFQIVMTMSLQAGSLNFASSMVRTSALSAASYGLTMGSAALWMCIAASEFEHARRIAIAPDRRSSDFFMQHANHVSRGQRLAVLIMSLAVWGHVEELAPADCELQYLGLSNDESLILGRFREVDTSMPMRDQIVRTIESLNGQVELPWWMLMGATVSLSMLRCHLDAFTFSRQLPTQVDNSLALAALSEATAATTPSFDDVRGWIVTRLQAREINQWFLSDAPQLMTEFPTRASGVLRAYEALRDDRLLPADFPPYSAALAVRDDPNRINDLPPEIREAVELLLGTAPAEVKSARPAAMGAARSETRRAYQVPAATLSIAADGGAAEGQSTSTRSS